MRISFAIHGSRGDAQPAIAVGVELLRRGHTVRFAVAADLVSLTASAGLPVQQLAPSTAELLASPLVKQRLKSNNPRTRLQAIREVNAYGAETSEQVMGELADESDLLVTGPMAQERAATIAESRGIAFTPLHYCPIRPSSRVPVGSRHLPRPLTWTAWTMVDRAYWLSVRSADRRLRNRLGMPPVHGPLGGRLRARGIPEIQAYDGALFPGLMREWGDTRTHVGFLVPDQLTRSALSPGDQTARAISWADDGQPPVYVGFGSMRIPRHRIEAIVTHFVNRGMRVLAHTDVVLAEHPRLCRVEGPIDHEQVLPRCAGAVHHGGAGTTAATVRAGIPSVIGWLSADQPIWAAAMTDAGAGVGNRLDKLGPRELDTLTDEHRRQAARRLASTATPPAVAVNETCRILLSRSH